ncbi:NUDIX hydrolase [Nocardiopsis ganjiahuensis]|uniref:hypothetical protein n=1 Tax=Nocardiopsis ganjiahuensis TaxID=239984 RepID=UPI00034BFD7F|nr:hypothetical protein [Nocardiopsis ganjiahuensis]
MDGTEDSQGRWVVHGERTLYDNPWVRLGKADITTPSGNRFEHVATFEPMIGTVRSPHHVFIGRDAELVADPTEFDEGIYEWVPLAKARSLIAEGRVQSSGTLVALLHRLAS